MITIQDERIGEMCKKKRDKDNRERMGKMSSEFCSLKNGLGPLDYNVHQPLAYDDLINESNSLFLNPEDEIFH
jgi:hypothetical protein